MDHLFAEYIQPYTALVWSCVWLVCFRVSVSAGPVGWEAELWALEAAGVWSSPPEVLTESRLPKSHSGRTRFSSRSCVLIRAAEIGNKTGLHSTIEKCARRPSAEWMKDSSKMSSSWDYRRYDRCYYVDVYTLPSCYFLLLELSGACTFRLYFHLRTIMRWLQLKRVDWEKLDLEKAFI